VGPEHAASSNRLGLSHKKGYRWDIQGMRAIAVVLVMLAHADVPGFEGGYIGVDVFFVISGFLITGLLLEDGAQHHRISFTRFYSRRARRILPAATVVIVATSIASVLILNAYQAKSELVDGMWAGFFAVNIRFARSGTNYFTKTAAIVSPLQHFWSLSVEEQFYVVWPALLAISGFGFLALRRRRRSRDASVELRSPSTARITATLLVLGGLSLLLSIHQTATDPHAAYFSTIDRAWELVVGALLAVQMPRVARLPDHVRAALTWTGLACIAIAATTFTAATPVPGSATLLPVLGSAAVLAGGLGAPRASASRLLSLGPMRFIGAISYSLYLWHWPILILAAAYFPFPLNLGQRLVLLVVATMIAVLSYAFIEIPFQRAKRLTRRSYSGMVLWPVAVSMVVIVALVGESEFSFVAASGPAVPGLSASAAVIDAVAAARANDPIPNATLPSVLEATSDYTYIGKCSGFLRERSEICEMGDPTGKKTVVLFGNSHSSMWIPTIRILAKQAGWKFFPVVKEACGYDDYAALRHIGIRNPCVVWYRWALGVIRALHPNVVVIGAYGYRLWAQGLSIIIPEVKPLTQRLVLIADVPGLPVVPGYCLSKVSANQDWCLWPEPKNRIADLEIARRLAVAAHIGFIDPESWFCYRHLCPSLINGVIPYYDTSHLTIDYARYLAPTLGAKLDLTGSTRSH
jgi:peptidoglycan/LPS O-acetylase OafA/YrhL